MSTFECPHCNGTLHAAPGVPDPPPDPSVEALRVQAHHDERMALIARGLDPDNPRRELGGSDGTEHAEIYAETEVAVAAEEASAEVAAAEAVGDAAVAAAEVVGDALEAAAEIATDDGADGELGDEAVVIVDDTTDEEEAGSKSLASKWGF